MNLVWIITAVWAQSTTNAPAPAATTSRATSNPSTTTSTSPPAPTLTAGNGTLSFEVRARMCTEGSTRLVNAFKQCFPLFPNTAPSTLEADNGAWTFIRCLCATEWRAGSDAQFRSSVSYCPAIPGISKGQQAAVAADCAAGVSQQGRIVESFGLRVFVNGKAYVPLSGLPPGVLSSAESIQLSVLATIILGYFIL